ncbi:MAG: DUF4382 domain-containing protein [Conexivisphaerales archaeon]
MVSRNAVIAAVLIVIVAAGGGGLYYYYSSGQVDVYATTGNPDPIYLTVQSVELHSKAGSWITVFNKTMTVQLNDNLSFLSSIRVPSGNYTEVRLTLREATVTIGSINVSVTVPSSKLEIPIVPGGLNVQGGSTVYLAVIFGPHLVSNGNGGYILSPVVTARQIHAPQPGTTVQYALLAGDSYVLTISKLV